MPVEKLQIVPVREAFEHEAYGFTVWLESNIEALGQRLGLNLTVLEREKSVGSFNVDLLCEDGLGRNVIVENQLERSDHDHLGKLLTYLVNLDAKIAIWVTPDPRPEHQRVIDWLNERSGADFSFYLVRVEAIYFGDSRYAPLFTVLTAPDTQTHEIGVVKEELADRHVHRLEFWKGLLERSRALTTLFSGRSPTKDHWLSGGSGRSGIVFNYLITTDAAGVELYIDVGDSEKNKAYFDELFKQREQIEVEFGDQLDWRRLDEKRSSRIIWMLRDFGGLHNPDSWPLIQDRMIDAMIRIDRVFRPRVRSLRS